jgi:hypothetical protein
VGRRVIGDDRVGLRKRKYAFLLALLCCALAVESVNSRGEHQVLSDVLRTVLGLAIWFIVFERSHERRVVGIIFGAAIAAGWFRYFLDPALDRALSLLDQAMLALFLWSAVAAILRDLFNRPGTGAENVLGAICGYLIAGNAWGRLNAVAYLLVPSAYTINPAVAALLPDWHGRVALFTYYSFTQVLTIGYSDVTPVRAPATTLSLFSALFGVFYTAVVVSQFVGLAQSASKKSPGDS